EMLDGWPKAAYAAQAMVARTFAVQYLERHGGRRISTDFEEAQAYQPHKVTDLIREAVDATRGRVITYEGEPIHAWFHAYAGGETASAREGLAFEEEEPPYIHSITLEPNPLVPEEYQRSEEHTSELQSRENLVCRLLLEKKKGQPRPRRPSSRG